MDDQEQNKEADEVIEKDEIIDYSAPDWFLQTIVEITNGQTEEGKNSITILTSGFLVSGILISGKEYFTKLGNNSESGINAYQTIIDKHYSRPPSGNDPLPTYIHLKEARYFHHSGKPVPGNMGLLWRGRLSEVSGFSFGQLSSETV